MHHSFDIRDAWSWLNNGNLDEGIVTVGGPPPWTEEQYREARRRRGYDPIQVILSKEQLEQLNENGCVNAKSATSHHRFTIVKSE